MLVLCKINVFLYLSEEGALIKVQFNITGHYILTFPGLGDLKRGKERTIFYNTLNSFSLSPRYKNESIFNIFRL